MRILALLILFAGPSVGQPAKKEFMSLLWRISGNGLSKPSYLYGTMHLTDKRLFNFSDSLYSSLEQTEGFAAELEQELFYLFKVTYTFVEGEKERCLGVAGPFSKVAGKVITPSIAPGLYDDAQFDTKKINAKLKEYLKQVEDYNKEMETGRE